MKMVRSLLLGASLTAGLVAGAAYADNPRITAAPCAPAGLAYLNPGGIEGEVLAGTKGLAPLSQRHSGNARLMSLRPETGMCVWRASKCDIPVAEIVLFDKQQLALGGSRRIGTETGG